MKRKRVDAGEQIFGWRSNELKFKENLERVKGIEPSLSAWEAGVMPLYDTRARRLFTRTLKRFEAFIVNGACGL